MEHVKEQGNDAKENPLDNKHRYSKLSTSRHSDMPTLKNTKCISAFTCRALLDLHVNVSSVITFP